MKEKIIYNIIIIINYKPAGSLFYSGTGLPASLHDVFQAVRIKNTSIFFFIGPKLHFDSSYSKEVKNIIFMKI